MVISFKFKKIVVMKIKILQENIPDFIPVEICYLGLAVIVGKISRIGRAENTGSVRYIEHLLNIPSLQLKSKHCDFMKSNYPVN